MFPAFLAAILFSISGICGHRAAKRIGGIEANFWRLTLSALFLAPVSYWAGVGLNSPSFFWFLLSGVVGIGIGDVAYFLALPKLGPRLSLLLIECLSAPVAAIIEWLWMGTLLRPAQILFGSLILVGVGFALSPGKEASAPKLRRYSGVTMCTISALAAGVSAVLSRKAFAIDASLGGNISALNAGFQRVLGGLFLAGVCLLLAKRREFRVQSRAPRDLVHEVAKKKWRSVWYWVVMNSLAGQTIGVTFMQWGLRIAPGGIVLAVIALTPILIIPLTVWVDGERPTATSILGSIVAVAGVIGLALV